MIIDPTRTITIECETVEIDGVEQVIWAIVTYCPVDGVFCDYFATREEAKAHFDEVYA